uniref:outer membrane protein assembly factor BamA n=1 Tax=uncultured Draconibacterium sp. TaxID=1573823 RepID=UPI003216C1F9
MSRIQKSIIALIFLCFVFVPRVFAQEADSTNFSIYYSSARKYTIADVQISGIKYLDKTVLIQLSGLTVGDEIMVPGDAITTAIRKLWQQGLFSDVEIKATKLIGDKIWLDIYLQERPRLADVNFYGVSKSEKDDITEKVLLLRGSQITDHQVNSAERTIKGIFHGKGFLNTEVRIVQRDDTTQNNSVILDINVDKKEKVKVNNIEIEGNEALTDVKLEKAMKKTNEKSLRNFFKTKKYLEEEYKNDKGLLIDKYNEKGYRDAIITSDSIYQVKVGRKEKTRVNIDLQVEEGNKYYFGDIRWVGNTVYPSEYLSQILGIKKGDVFNQKILDKRLFDNDLGMNNVYLDKGYLFFNLDPVEVNINKDTIDYEMRIYEGKQATINEVRIVGNTKTHEHVARRELRTYPGDLFSKSLLMRSYRELAQLGHFDPEAINPDVQPHPEEGTVDIEYQLQEKANDQIELSGGWGAGMFVGSVGLKFANFSVRNIFNKEAWRPLPTGDGQTLSLRYQTSGKYYRTVSLSFIEPWLGGKKPNSFSISLSHSRINYSANKYYQSYNPYGGYGGYGGYSPYGYGGYGGYSPYGYGSYGGYGGYGGYGSYGYPQYNYNYDSEDSNEENDQIWETTALALGYGYRLSWPDDYFTVYHELSFEHYNLRNMQSYFYFLVDENGKVNGTFDNFSFKTVFGRSSVDSPLYSRRGSNISLALKLTPPYSVFSNKDYSDPELPNSEKYKWIEYHKWLFKGQLFSPLTNPGGDHTLVLKTAFEMGFLGYYNKNIQSPFEGFIVGGSGMSGYNIYGTDYISLRGYKDYALSPNNGSNMYSKFTSELRFPVTLKPSATIYALAFLEAGNAGMSFQDYTPFKLRRSAGVGVRIFLPMFGLMGIDWGYGFDGEGLDQGAAGSQFHFVIGQQF